MRTSSEPVHSSVHLRKLQSASAHTAMSPATTSTSSHGSTIRASIQVFSARPFAFSRTRSPRSSAHDRSEHRRSASPGDAALARPLILYEAVDRLGLRQLLRSLYRMDIEGAENIPAEGPCILVANHESLIDPFILGAVTTRKIRYMAKAELFQYPLLKQAMQAVGTLPVELGRGGSTGCC